LARAINFLGGWASDRWLEITHPESRVSFSIPTHMTKRERLQLYRLSRSARRVLEIGSYLGASASCFAAAMSASGTDGKVLCVDTWGNETMPEGLRDTYAEFCRNTAVYARFIVPVRGLSAAVADQVKAETESVDLLFIDGDHSYESVLADWQAYSGMLKPGSVVVFHDWDWAEGVKRVIQENVAPLIDHSGNLPNMWWGRIR
jgi:predicted O-methyltransferase YrrM